MQPRTSLSLIIAVAENGVIGRDGDLPWRMSSDLKTFRRLTMGKPIIMGRRTFQSLKKPLDGRHNIVITRDTNFTADGVTVVHSVEAALEAAQEGVGTVTDVPEGTLEIMVIGGADIYRLTLPMADRLYVTQVHASPNGDTYFEPLDETQWQRVSSQTLDQGPRDDYPATLHTYERAHPLV
jgi:dihydrofolate reductase